MDWKKAAAEDLRRYKAQKESLDNIQERIAILEEQFTGVKGATLDKVPSRGGGSNYEDKMINNIVERERLKLTYVVCSKLVRLIEKGLEGLSEKERRVLELFFISPARGNVERLMEELGYEKAQIYRIREDALYKFTIKMYGLIDL